MDRSLHCEASGRQDGFYNWRKSSRAFSNTQVIPYTADKRELELKRLLKGLAELQSQPDIAITELFFPSDKRDKAKEYQAEIKKEVDGLLARGVFKNVKKNDVHPMKTFLQIEW